MTQLALRLSEQPRGAQQAAVLEYIEAQGAYGATDIEIQRALGLPGDSQRPRRGELEAKGLIAHNGEMRDSGRGKKAKVWVTT